MKTLGHSQIGLTMNTYTHVLPEIERAAIDAAAKENLRVVVPAAGCTLGCTGTISARTSVHASDGDLGAGERIRTADLPFTRRLLCQLSYTGGRLGAW